MNKEGVIMTKDIAKYLKTFFVIMFYFTYNNIAVYILKRFGIDIYNISQNMLIFINLIIDILFMIILFLVYYKDIINDIRDFKKNYKSYLRLAFKWWIFALLFMYISNIIIYIIVKSNASNEEIIHSMVNKYPLYMLFQVSIMAPFVEEMLFRKSIRDIVTNKYLYIIISALIFGGLHVLTSKSYLEMLYIIPYGVFGGIFAYIYCKTKNIFSTITVHHFHNTIIVLYYIFCLILGKGI